MFADTAEAHISVNVKLLEQFVAGGGDPECSRWAEYAAAAVDSLPCGIVVSLDGYAGGRDAATVAARAVAENIIAALRRRWSLPGLMPEYGAPQTTSVGEDRRSRTLLPHHDGGSASYLTPSRLHVPDWPVEDRSSFPARVTPTRAHKLYQGFLVQAAGDASSITPYYEMVTLLRLAFRHQTGGECPGLVALQQWCARNLKHAMGLIRAWGGGYVQLGALLGARSAKHILVNLHNLNDGFSQAELSAFPDIASAGSNAGALFEEMILETTGLRWPDVCRLAERRLTTRRYDLVFGHNILLMHGGIDGSADRLLDPICAVIEHASGDAYEHWLAEAWSAAYRRATGGVAAERPARQCS